MITSQDFERLIYKKPYLRDERSVLQNIEGIDSESYNTGEPFLFCTSKHDSFTPKDIPHVFFTKNYHKVNFVTYNLKYDSGALLYFMPIPNLKELWKTNETKWFFKSHESIYSVEYIPHKLLRFKKDKSVVNIWDIAQFYKMSLDNAAKRYLNSKKNDIETKSFSKEYVSRFRETIIKYCIQDAILTKRLAQFLVDKLYEFGIKATALYSCASISFKYFSDNANIITSWRYYKDNRDVLEYACDAYQGGKFEVTARGYYPNMMEYDISSAYPYEIANLKDITNAKVYKNKSYIKEADYAFYRVKIYNPKGLHLPCGIMIKNVRIYPAGEYYLTITKAEYEYLKSLDISMDIFSAIHLVISKKVYPYRKLINTLFELKQSFKGNDSMLYSVTKIVANSFYGKCVQCIENYKKEITAGQGWNPVFGSVITANTRIKIARLQNLLKNNCFGVHTDSVIVTDPIPLNFCSKKLGRFDFELQGEGVIIACGMYQIDNKNAYKGFKPKKFKDKKDSWKKILSRNPKAKEIKYKQLYVESWCDAMAKNHERNKINLFNYDSVKNIDLNCDTKRIWEKKATGESLLKGMEYSTPRLYIENNPPKFWLKKPKNI